MAVPKRKHSRSNTRHRRSAWKATAPTLVTVRVDGRDVRVPRHLVAAVHRGLLDPATLPSAGRRTTLTTSRPTSPRSTS